MCKNKELANYLKSKNGLNRLFYELRQKYISLGRYSGSVVLNSITEEESIDISNLLGRKVEVNGNLKTSFSEITKRIEQGKYHGFEWQELFQFYFNYKILSKKEQKNIEDLNEINFFKSLIEEHTGYPYIDKMLEMIQSEKNIYKIMRQKYRKDKDSFRHEFHNIFLLLSNIPSKSVSLPVFSSITGNPHYLDFDRSESNLFLKVLSYLKNEDNPISIQDRVNLLSQINVYTDPISNFAITYQLIGNTILDCLASKRQVLNLNLLNIDTIKQLDTRNKKVFIFENPSILNALMGLEEAIVITSGIPNLAVYRILDKLRDSEVEMYYNGDFDAEGLVIAEKLKDRYPNLKLFCYDTKDYENSQSEEIISDSRLKKLDKVVDPDLKEIKNILLKKKIAAYQERNIDRIEEYIEMVQRDCR